MNYIEIDLTAAKAVRALETEQDALREQLRAYSSFAESIQQIHANAITFASAYAESLVNARQAVLDAQSAYANIHEATGAVRAEVLRFVSSPILLSPELRSIALDSRYWRIAYDCAPASTVELLIQNWLQFRHVALDSAQYSRKVASLRWWFFLQIVVTRFKAVKKRLKEVQRAIKARFKAFLQWEFPHAIIQMESRWFQLHGSHPPHPSVASTLHHSGVPL